MQYTENILVVKIKIFNGKENDIFLNRLWVQVRPASAWQGGSNEYPQSMFWSKNKKNRCKPQFFYIKVGFKGVNIAQACFPDDVLSIPLSSRISILGWVGFAYVIGQIS